MRTVCSQEKGIRQNQVQDHGQLAQVKAERAHEGCVQVHQVSHIVRKISDNVNQRQDGRTHDEGREPGARHILVQDARTVVQEHSQRGEKAAQKDEPGPQELGKGIFGRRTGNFPLHLGPFPGHQKPGCRSSQRKQEEKCGPLAEMSGLDCHEKRGWGKNARSGAGNKALFGCRTGIKGCRNRMSVLAS